jgi:hypothetical protein
MTYGLLLDRARQLLGEAAAEAAATCDPAVLANWPILRSYVYRQLRRHIELLTADPFDRPHVALALVDALQTAAGPVHAVSSSARARSALGAGGDMLGVAADVYVGHITAGRAQTPEGAAILAARGGADPALFDIAEMTLDLIAVDRALCEDRPAGQHALVQSVHAAAVAAARPATTGPLAGLARDLVAIHGAAGPSIVRLLDTPPLVSPDSAPASVTSADAAAHLHAVRTWLWRNPHQLRADHLRLGARLGLALATTQPYQPLTQAWSNAAAATRRVSGAAPIDEARTVAETIRSLGRWTIASLEEQDQTDMAELVDQLPVLAGSLSAALPTAVNTCDILVSTPVLRRPTGSPIALAVDVWRPANLNGQEIADLREALDRAARIRVPGRPESPPTPARSAFRNPSGPGEEAVAPARPRAESDARTRRRHR